jgi:hypothetical protein
LNLADTGPGLRSDTVQADEAFRRSIDSLSQLLASRSADPPPALPDIEFFTERDKTPVFRRPSATAALLLVAAIAAVFAGLYSALNGAVPPENHKPENLKVESHKIDTIAAATVAPSVVARPAESIATIVPPPVDAAPVARTESPPPKTVVSQPLDSSGIAELQTKLSVLGFAPGPIDGVAGPLTVAAIKRYQQSRGRAQTGAADVESLDQLRKEKGR